MSRPRLARLAAPTLAGTLSALLAGCGGAAKTTSVSGAPTVTASTTQPSTTQPSTTTPASTAATPTSGNTTTSGEAPSGGTPASTDTRTAPEPQFAEEQRASSAEGVSNALATVRAHGYAAKDAADYHPNQTLRVLIGTRTGSSVGSEQQAFFFIDGRYLGTDASAPSAQLKVLDQSDTEVTLAYGLYRSTDPLCCPSGGEARVRFQLNNGRLTALDPIPATEPGTGLGRR